MNLQASALTSYGRLRHDKRIIFSPTKSQSVTIVIPVLNEEGNLEKLFEYIEQTFELLTYTLPVLVIDDGSTDSSPDILKNLRQQHDFLQIVRHPQRRGVAEVWVTALRHAKTDWIFWGQADLESDPRSDIPALLNAYRPGVDAIAGWRQGRGDGKLMASSTANLACRIVFASPIHDMNWIKLVRRDLLSSLPVALITHRYLLPVLSAQGYTVIETPTPWHERFSGSSKFGRKRLFTSARDFMRTAVWFYGLQPIERVGIYALAALKAISVGVTAAKRSWNLQLQASRAVPQAPYAAQNRMNENSSIQAMARHLRLAASKVNADLASARF